MRPAGRRSPPRGQLCWAAEPVRFPSSTPHGQWHQQPPLILPVTTLQTSKHQSPESLEQSKKAGHEGASPLASAAQVLISLLSPPPLFFTLCLRQGPDPLVGPYRQHLELEDSEKAGASCSRPTCCCMSHHACPFPSCDWPVLSSVMQDGTAQALTATPTYSQVAFLLDEGWAWAQRGQWLLGPSKTGRGNRQSGLR